MSNARSTASRTVRPPASTTDGVALPERYAAAIVALLRAVEGLPPDSPAASAYRAAIRRKGEALAAEGPPDALAHAVTLIRIEAPSLAEHRAAVLTAAWAGLPGAPPTASGG